MKWIAISVVSVVALAAALLFTGEIGILQELIAAVRSFGN